MAPNFIRDKNRQHVIKVIDFYLQKKTDYIFFSKMTVVTVTES